MHRLGGPLQKLAQAALDRRVAIGLKAVSTANREDQASAADERHAGTRQAGQRRPHQGHDRKVQQVKRIGDRAQHLQRAWNTQRAALLDERQADDQQAGCDAVEQQADRFQHVGVQQPLGRDAAEGSPAADQQPETVDPAPAEAAPTQGRCRSAKERDTR